MPNTRALYFEWSRRVGGNPSGGENEMSLIRQIARARGVTDAGNANKTQALRAIAETYGKSSGRQNYLGALRSIVDALDAVPVGYYLGHMNERDCLQAIVGAVEDSTAVDQHLECTAIAGATNSTYVLDAADEGFYIRCKVTATNSEGSDFAWSNAVGPVETAAVPGPFLDDTFTGANGTNALYRLGEVAGAWSLGNTFPNGEMVIAGNRLRGNNASFTIIRSAGVPASADYSVTAVLHHIVDAGQSVGPCGRVDHSGGNGYFALFVDSVDEWQLYKCTNGVLALLDSAVQVLAATTDYTVELRMLGTSIKMFVDAVEVCSATDSTHTQPGTAAIWNNGSILDGTGIHVASITGDDGGLAPLYATNFAVVVDGDSLSGDYGLEGTKTISQLLSDESRLNTGAMWNFSVPSQTIVQAETDAVTQIDPVFAAMAGYTKKLCVCMCGVNDLFAGASAATLRTNTITYHANRQAEGFETVVFTVAKAVTIAGAAETERQAYNTALRADHAFADYFVDVDADAAFDDTSDLVYYQADGVHFTVAGRIVIADLIVAEVS